jgi:exosortase D (VPLPA-CTERM-specific)
MWDKRKEFQFIEFSLNFWGIIPIFLSLTLMIMGEIGSVETFLYLGIWGCIVSLFVIFYGRRVRILLFPLFILLFIVPLPPFINNTLTFQLKLAASTFAVSMLRLTGASVFREGNIIDLGTTQLQVVDACSGLRYVMPMIVMALVIGYLFINGWWRRSLLLAIVPPLSLFVNTFRIFVAGVLHLKGHPRLAEDFFHDFSGWLVFMFAGVLLVGFAFILNKIAARHNVNSELDPGGIDSYRLQPLALLVLLTFLFVGTSWAIQKLPSARNMPQRQNFSSFPMKIGDWKGTPHSISQEILSELWADDYLSATFQQSYSNNKIHLFIPFYEYQGTRHTAHAPQSCLIGGGWTLLDTREYSIIVNNGKSIAIKGLHLRKGDIKLLSAYFFFQRGRVITNPWLNKFYLMWDSITQFRTDGGLVRVEMMLLPNQTMENAYKTLNEFIANLYDILPYYVPV